jgi:vacuolar-type H+-ATPase subunit F/Vma7
MTVRVVCRAELSAGFELAGLAVTRVQNNAEAAEAIKRLAADAEVGIILVDETLYGALPHDLVARLDRQALPMLAPVPDPGWEDRSVAEAYVMDILRQAIGYRVRAR